MSLTFASNKLITDADMSASFQSEAISLHNKIGFSIHCVFTGSPNGSFYIAVSIDGENWVLLPDSTQVITAAGDHFYNVNDSKYLWARLHWSFSSGTGTNNSKFSTKEVI